MKLITAHRILIAAGIAFFFLYALIRAREYAGNSSMTSLVHAVVSVAIAIGLIVYYRSLRHWGRR